MANMPKKFAKSPGADVIPLPTEFVAPAMETVESMKESIANFQTDARTAVQKGVEESGAAFAQAKASSEEATAAFRQSYSAAREGVIAINTKAFEALRVNAEANFNFMKAAFAVKSLPDLIALQNEFARKQVDALTLQTKDIGALTQKTMTSAMGPIKDQVAKSFKIGAFKIAV